MIPSTPVSNKYFSNQGGLQFSEETEASNLGQAGFSHGAAYADLDLDGDLDLVINNMDSPAGVYRNNSAGSTKRNYLRVKLEGNDNNTFGLGTKVTIESGEVLQYQELTLTRGYKSSVEPILHFGLGSVVTVDRLLVEWPNGTKQLLKDLKTNQVLSLNQSEANKTVEDPWIQSTTPMFVDAAESTGIAFKHKENPYDDFFREVLLPHKTSQFGPKTTQGDVNSDKAVDFFIGGAAGQAGVLWLQNAEGHFNEQAGPWIDDADFEDIGSLLFDADGDQDLDLYVVSGGNEFPADSEKLQDRLYRNDGSGSFSRDDEALPKMITSGACVAAGDYDGDGDLDLFVGGRLLPRKYPYPPKSYLLENKEGQFIDVTEKIAPELASIGMVSSAEWLDLNEDRQLDLILAGEWMPISIFEQSDSKFTNQTDAYGLGESTGWWNTLLVDDFDSDGRPDLVAGNLGLNYKYHATVEEPIHIYGKDFDLSGTSDIVLGHYSDGTCVPVRGLQCSSQQIPGIREKFSTFKDFAHASLPEIYGFEKLDRALHYEAKLFASCILTQNDHHQFEITPLPTEAQLAPTQGMVSRDFNNDGNIDLLLAGNFFVAEVETGRADAGNGLLLLGKGDHTFEAVPLNESGFYAPGDVRDLAILEQANGAGFFVLVANNDDKLQVFKTSKEIQK